MQQNIYPKDLSVSLDEFVQQMRQLNKADNPELVSQLITKWTKAQPLLTKKLLQYVLESKQKISSGDEAYIVERIVRNRLIKEFKQDELTLNIRKLLYTKDLIGLVKKTQGNIAKKEQIYLKSLQNELGLLDRQCQPINNNYLPSSSLGKNSYFLNKNNNIAKFNYHEVRDSYQDLLSLVEKSSEEEKISVYDKTTSFNHQEYTISNRLKKKNWLLPIAFLLLWLFIEDLNVKRGWQIINAVNVEQKESDCTNSLDSQSPRMSLGEKFLTQKHNNLMPSSKIALYEATAAFTQCKYSIAESKFQTALELEKNNPEALIYLNNAIAIVRDHFKIAVSVPLGNKPEIAWEILRGVAQAQTEINQQGGIRGKLLLVQIVNDDNNPEIARQVAKQLTADQNVLAVVGHNDSDASIAASNIYQKHELVMVSPTSSTTKLSDIGSYIMRTTPSVAVLANTLASYALVGNYSKVAVCSDSGSSASKSFTREFIAEITKDGGEILPVRCDFAKENFNPVPIVEQAISQNADALLLASSVERSYQAIAVAQANQQRLPLLGNHSLYTFETIQAEKAVAGMVLPVPWLPETIPNSNFSKTTMKFWGGKVNWRTAMAYDATKAIIQGLKQSDSRAQLQSVMTEQNFQVNGSTGTFGLKQGERVGKVQLAYIASPDENQNKYWFAKLDINDKINQSLP